MAFAVVSKSKAGPRAVAGLLKQLLRAAPSASASRAAPAAAALLRPACGAVAARRLFSAGGAPLRRVDDDDDDYSGEEKECITDKEEVAYGRLRSPRGFSIVPDPGAGDKPTCACGRLLEEAAAPRRGCVVLGAVWRSKEDADAVKLKVAMPGLGEEHVKVCVDQGVLWIEGEGEKDPEYDDDDEPPAWYGNYIEFPEDAYKLDQMEAEMKDGVLMVTVPKIKPEECEDVLQVKVE